MKRITVTGGLGFLGQHVVQRLRDAYPQSTITVLARSRRDIFLDGLEGDAGMDIIHGADLLQPRTLEPHIAGAHAVFHAAAKISFWRKHRKTLYATNIDGTRNVLALCRKHDIEKLVYVSSTAAVGYNNDKDAPTDESHCHDWRKARRYPYMMSKRLAEREVRQAASTGLPAVIANLSTIYGPGDSKIFPLIDNLKSGKVPAALPGGFAIIDVRDAAAALVCLLEKGRQGENYLFTGGNYTYREVMRSLAEAIGTSPPPKTLPMGLGNFLVPVISMLEAVSPKEPKLTTEILAMGFKYRYYNSGKAREQLGWKPTIGLDDTFRDAVRYYNSIQKEEKS